MECNLPMPQPELENHPAATLTTEAETFSQKYFGIPVTLTHTPRLGRNHLPENGTPGSVGHYDHATGRITVSPLTSDILYETILTDPDSAPTLLTQLDWALGTYGLFSTDNISPTLSKFIRLSHTVCQEFVSTGNPILLDTVLLLMDRLPYQFQETSHFTNHLLDQLLLVPQFAARYRHEVWENAVHESAHAWLFQVLKPQLLTEREWDYLKSLLAKQPATPDEIQIKLTDPDSFGTLPLAEVKNMALRSHQAFARRFPHQPEIQEALITSALFQGVSEEIARAITVHALNANDEYDPETLRQYASRLGFIPHAGNGDHGIMFFRRLIALGGLPRLRDAAIRLWEDLEDMAKFYTWQTTQPTVDTV